MSFEHVERMQEVIDALQDGPQKEMLEREFAALKSGVFDIAAAVTLPAELSMSAERFSRLDKSVQARISAAARAKKGGSGSDTTKRCSEWDALSGEEQRAWIMKPGNRLIEDDE